MSMSGSTKSTQIFLEIMRSFEVQSILLCSKSSYSFELSIHSKSCSLLGYKSEIGKNAQHTFLLTSHLRWDVFQWKFSQKISQRKRLRNIRHFISIWNKLTRKNELITLKSKQLGDWMISSRSTAHEPEVTCGQIPSSVERICWRTRGSRSSRSMTSDRAIRAETRCRRIAVARTWRRRPGVGPSFADVRSETTRRPCPVFVKWGLTIT